MDTYDILIVGAGHNGLAAAGLLAKAGKRVLVLERRDQVGGIASTEEIFPGMPANTGFPGAPLLLPQVIDSLELQKHGLAYRKTPVFAYSPQINGPPLVLWADPAAPPEGLAGRAADAMFYTRFMAFTRRLGGVLGAMMPLEPPDLKGPYSVRELWPWARLALKARGLGKRDLMEFLRVLPMRADELLDEWFDSEAIKGTLAVFSTIGAMLGPMGAGTALNLLYWQTGRPDPGFVAGGIGQVSAALQRAAESHGAEVRLGTAVERILVENGAVAGVRLASGETIASGTILSSAGPGHTLLELAGPEHLPVKTVRRLRNIRYRGSTATVHLLLSKTPDFGQSSPDHLSGYLVFCPSVDYLEKAYDEAKYGRPPKQPALLGHFSDTAGPDGERVLSLMVRYAPYRLRDGNWEEARSQLESAVVDILKAYSAELPALVQGTRSFTPLDYDRYYGLPDGAWMHGQMGLDQLLMMRPAPGLGRYRTPVSGLYLAGSGSHPGGSVTGAPGWNAARTVLGSRD